MLSIALLLSAAFITANISPTAYAAATGYTHGCGCECDCSNDCDRDRDCGDCDCDHNRTPVDMTAFAAQTQYDHEHWWYIAGYVEPTCTEQGYTEHQCYFCGESRKDNYIAAFGHDFLEITVEPTCTSRGYTTHFCTVCGFEYVDNYTEGLGHDFRSEVIEPTCTTDGYTLYVCLTDGYSYKDNYIYAYGHDYIPDVLEPTCTEGGYTTYTCYHCGDSYVDDYTAPNGHSYYELPTEPTCVAYGYTEHICYDCGDRYVTDYVRPHGHDYEKIVVKPTENSAGYTVNLCKQCDYSYLSDFVTSGDIDFEEHIHEYSLFVARYDAQSYFLLQYYCDCGEVDNSQIHVLFIDDNGNYIPQTINGYGEVRYAHLSGNYNVFILDNHGEVLSNFRVSVNINTEAPHTHEYSLSLDRRDEDKYFVLRYYCDCGEVNNSLVYAVFIDGNGDYTTLNPDGNGEVRYNRLVGDFNVLILNNHGEILANFNLTVIEDEIPEEHIHDYELSVTRHDGDKYFAVNYLCDCGEIENSVFYAVFIDGNGNNTTIAADEYGNIYYPQLCGSYNVFILGSNGEMLNNFKLTVIEEHIHEFKLTVVRADEQKYFTIKYLCECDEIEQAAFHIIFIDNNGDSTTLYADGNGKVDYSGLVGSYNVFIFGNYGEVLTSFNLTVAEEVIHYHDYSLSVVRNDNDKFFTVNYVCDCGEIQNGIFQALFVNENGDYITMTVDGSGKVDYSQLVGKYNVFILGSHSEMLYNFKLTIAEVIPHSHDFELSIVRYDDEKYLTVNYVCECGEVETAVFSVNFIGENGGSTIIYADQNGKVDYSQLVGKYNVFVINESGGILNAFKLTVAPEHTHDYTLSITRYDDEKCFVMEYICNCGENETDTVYAIFMDGRGDYVTLFADGLGKVDYSQLIGKYNIFIMNNEGKLLSSFRLTIAEEVVHSHYYTLTVTRYDEEKYFTAQYVCECGEIDNVMLNAVFIGTNGNYLTLNPDANGKVDYSQLVGRYNVLIQNGQGEILANFTLFELSADSLPIENEDTTIDEPIDKGKSPLPIILLIILVIIAAGGTAAFILNKKRNKKI
jgi:hypothetical protein